LDRIVVVGASLAGLSALEALRGAGYEGELVAIGAEAALPYDRPPLSKQVLQGAWEPEQANLRDAAHYEPLEIDWRLGRRAASLDLERRAVALDDGEPLAFDGLVIATGATPRNLPDSSGTPPAPGSSGTPRAPGTPPLAGVFVLRTLEDCLALRKELEGGPRVCVVGGGFIGSEVAATCRSRGLEVTVLEALPAPLARAFPAEMGAACAALHQDHGVDLRTSAGVEGLDGRDRVERVRLAGGGSVAADVVVVGVGVVPATDWLESSGLELRNGVVCDETCATAAPGVVAAGDIARWPNRLFGEEMRIEHWSNAVEQGAAAAKRLLASPEAAEPFAPVPYFWSDQYDTKIQFLGRAAPDDAMAVVDGSLADGRFVALFGRAGRVVGALAFNRPRQLMAYRRLIAGATSWDDALAKAAAG
jgi:NADPH-dependent 2,4-dienoyl-CoA reductase/sulfur reductase-like enzyme